jgi:OFA family oxalate/formate antiporter-like MFS transporter
LKLTGDWQGLYGMDWSVNEVWLLYGICFAVLVGIGSMVLVNPPDGWQPKGWIPPEAGKASSGGVDWSASQMIGTPQFWGLFLTFTFGATAGLMVIGVIKLFGTDALMENGIETDRANIITGTAMGLFYALFNGLGRIIWGSISDWTGRTRAIILMCILQGLMMIGFYFSGGHPWGLYLGAAVIGFNFGGNFALFPAATADLFGNKRVGENYPYVFLAYGVGGIIGPLLGGLMRDVGQQSGDISAWMWAFIPAGVACFVGAAIMGLMRPPKAVAKIAAEPATT